MDILASCFQGILDGRSKESLYTTYSMMVRRCYDPTMSNYHNYGAIGIDVDPRWLGKDGFWDFISDVGKRPDNTTLDRIDPFKGYSKENCRWADRATQANNTRMQFSNNTSGVHGVSWSKRDEHWTVQINLFGKRTKLGVFSFEDLDQAQSLFLDAKELKNRGVAHQEIYEKFVLNLRVGNKNTAKRRNKTSEFWGVSYNSTTDKWLAVVYENKKSKYLGVRATEKEAHDLVVLWLESQKQK